MRPTIEQKQLRKLLEKLALKKGLGWDGADAFVESRMKRLSRKSDVSAEIKSLSQRVGSFEPKNSIHPKKRKFLGSL